MDFTRMPWLSIVLLISLLLIGEISVSAEKGLLDALYDNQRNENGNLSGSARHPRSSNPQLYSQGTNDFRYRQSPRFPSYQQRTNDSWPSSSSNSQDLTRSSVFQQTNLGSRYQQMNSSPMYQQGVKDFQYQQDTRSREGIKGSTYQQATTGTRFKGSNAGYGQASPGSKNNCYETTSRQQAFAYNYTELCLDSNNVGNRYPVKGVCFAYFECEGRESLYRQCAQTCSFDPYSMKCVPNNSCKTACPLSIDVDPLNPDGFLLGGVPKACPPRTYFDFRICTCNHK